MFDLVRGRLASRGPAVLCLAALGLLLPTPAARAQLIDPTKVPLVTEGYLSNLTAQWWQWTFRVPASTNPLLDDTGIHASNGQPLFNVFFLCGAFSPATNPLKATVTRSITVPAGKSLFFPILNYEDDNVGIPPANQLTLPQLRAATTAQVNNAADMFVTLDGVSLASSVVRVQSPTFSYTLPAVAAPDQNILQYLGINVVGTIGPAVADGYWILIPPLKPGVSHTLHFGGTFPNAPFTLDLTYHIVVIR